MRQMLARCCDKLASVHPGLEVGGFVRPGRPRGKGRRWIRAPAPKRAGRPLLGFLSFDWSACYPLILRWASRDRAGCALHLMIGFTVSAKTRSSRLTFRQERSSESSRSSPASTVRPYSWFRSGAHAKDPGCSRGGDVSHGPRRCRPHHLLRERPPNWGSRTLRRQRSGPRPAR